jgi:single-strand DNA-binding protein
MNKVFLIGNLTRHPELSETPNGIAYCRFSIAVNKPTSDAVDYFNIVTWRGQAENCNKYLSKGRKVAIVGTLQNRSYEDKDGNKRTVTEIVANEVEFLSATNSSLNDNNGSQGQNSASQMVLEEVDDDGDLPF